MSDPILTAKGLVMSDEPSSVKTQMGPSQVPIDYMLMAKLEDAVKTSEEYGVFVNGLPVILEDSEIPQCKGSECGVPNGGLKSGTNGEKSFPSDVEDRGVYIGDKKVVCAGDPWAMDGKSAKSCNTTGITMKGSPNVFIGTYKAPPKEKVYEAQLDLSEWMPYLDTWGHAYCGVQIGDERPYQLNFKENCTGIMRSKKADDYTILLGEPGWTLLEAGEMESPVADQSAAVASETPQPAIAGDKTVQIMAQDSKGKTLKNLEYEVQQKGKLPQKGKTGADGKIPPFAAKEGEIVQLTLGSWLGDWSSVWLRVSATSGVTGTMVHFVVQSWQEIFRGKLKEKPEGQQTQAEKLPRPAEPDFADSKFAEAITFYESGDPAIRDQYSTYNFTDGESVKKKPSYKALPGHEKWATPGHEDITTWTIEEVQTAQKGLGKNMGDGKRLKLFAVGRYQIVPETLKLGLEALHLDRAPHNQQKFDKTIQDRLFNEYLLKKKRAEIWDYLIGKHNDVELAAYVAAKEWAAIGIRQCKKLHRGGLSEREGMSYYEGVEGNVAAKELMPAQIIKHLKASQKIQSRKP